MQPKPDHPPVDRPPPGVDLPPCAAEELLCSGRCVDPKTDDANCGGCGKACTGTAHCITGTCCLPGLTPCQGACVDVTSDHDNCGKCGNVCLGDGQCSNSLCCPPAMANCGGACVDLKTDGKNCGVCGKTCNSGETCTTGTCAGVVVKACASGTEDQTFDGTMRGCKGHVSFSSRATLCNTGYRVCTAQEWMANRGTTKPTHIYWTNDVLYANSGSSSSCAVRMTPPWTWCDASTPMRVCSGHSDAEGNACNWINCGYLTQSPNHYFGGCQGNWTAGALCCK